MFILFFSKKQIPIIRKTATQYNLLTTNCYSCGSPASNTVTTPNNTYYPYSYPSTNSTTVYHPSYGVVGSRTERKTRIYYSHFLSLFAFSKVDFKRNFNRSILWKLIAQTNSYNDDLRKYFPLLIVSAKDYIGISSLERKSISISDDNNDVINLKTKTEPKIKDQILQAKLSAEEIMLNNYIACSSCQYQSYASVSEVKNNDVVYLVSPYGEKYMVLLLGKLKTI
jgi:hypothetical protein